MPGLPEAALRLAVLDLALKPRALEVALAKLGKSAVELGLPDLGLNISRLLEPALRAGLPDLALISAALIGMVTSGRMSWLMGRIPDDRGAGEVGSSHAACDQA